MNGSGVRGHEGCMLVGRPYVDFAGVSSALCRH